MSAAVAAARPAPDELRRVLRTVRVQALNWPMQFWFPFAIFTAVLPTVVVTSVRRGGDAGEAAVFLGLPLTVVMCISLGAAHWRTIVHLFSFAVGLGITRRAFYLATTLVAVVQGVVLGGLLALLAQVEAATGGWGVGERVLRLGTLSPAASWVAYTLTFLVCAAIGVLFGAVHERWGPPALWVMTLGCGVLAGVGVGLRASLGPWTGATLLAGVPVAVLLVGGPLLLAAGLGLTGFAVLRRAVP